MTSSEAAEKGTYHPPPALGGPPDLEVRLLLAALLCIGVIVCALRARSCSAASSTGCMPGGTAPTAATCWPVSCAPWAGSALVYLGYSLFSYVKMQLLNRVVSRYFTCELRIRISDKHPPPARAAMWISTPVGDILSRMMDDVSTMGNYVHQIIDTLMTGFFMILAIAVMMLLEDWRLAAIVLVLTPRLHPAVDAPVLPQ